MTDLAWRLLLDAYEPKTKAAQYPTPGILARHINHHTKQTPALDLIDQALVQALNTPDARLIISMPPQEGKSVRVAGDFPVWALMQNPDCRIVTASYGADLATRNGRAIRRRITSNDLGLTIASDNGAVGDWTLDGHEGGVFSIGIGGGVTGRPADMLIIDDPIKSRAEAESSAYRERVWDWWTDEASARLAPGAPAVLIMCMTGDTPVLMADGSEKPLRDVRPGDMVATYEDGGLATAIVRNWANQGPDDLLCIKMKSGRTVRANARHPFLVINADGSQEWLRTDRIQPGQSILTATGGSGAACSAQKMAANSLSPARVSAGRTTTRPGGLLACAPTQHPAAALASSIDTNSPMKRLTSSSSSKVDSAPSADSPHLTATPGPTGTESCASITTTTPGQCAECCAMTATSQSGMGRPPKSCAQLLTTWSVTPDEVMAVEPCGREDVYDVQIDRTENFIANGLVSHNTRWHTDDLAGRLVERDVEAGWQVLNIPAQCDDPAGDPLGRQLGEFMISARGRSRRQWELRKATAGSRSWNALYQGRPAPAEGGAFQRSWWKRWGQPPALRHGVIQSWDMTFKGTDHSDFVVGQVWAIDGPNMYLLDQARGRWSFVETVRQVELMRERWPQTTATLVEDKANGTAVIDLLSRRIPGLIPVQPQGGKEVRAAAVSPFVEAGNVWLPVGQRWADDLIDEAAAFPNSSHDDQVDALTQALTYMHLTQPARQDFGTAFWDIG